VLEHLLERIEAQEARDKEDARRWASVRQSMHRLRERIEMLEKRPAPGAAAQPPAPQPAPPVAPAGGLVERVDRAIVRAEDDRGPKGEARAAIREVAAWLNERDTSIQNDPNCLKAPFTDDAIRWLREEADQ
jgi:hypothetical protein